MSTPMPETPAARCRRCGECCLRGGPTLMREDAPLLAGEGALPLEALVCLRAGEWARDDARGVLRPLDRELLKLAGTGEPGHPWRCLYYRDGAGCGIYARRPVQCRVLLCADTAPLEALLANRQNLGRCAALEVWAEALAGAGPGLPSAARACWPELAGAHDEACPAGKALALASALGFRPRLAPAQAPLAEEDREAARAELAELVRYDAAFRELCATRGRVPARVLPFLLGRPLAALLWDVGLRVG